MRQHTIGWRFASAFALALLVLAVGALGASKFGVPGAALADEDFLALNPERE
jgi:hypothetical protein